MIVNAYLVITANRSRYYNSRSASLRVTKGAPDLNSNEIAVKLQINVPDTVFDRPIPTLKLDMPQDLVMNPDAEVVTQITAQTVAEALRLDVRTVEDGLVKMLKKRNKETK